MKSFKTILFALMVSTPLHSFGQYPATLDSTFNGNGIKSLPLVMQSLPQISSKHLVQPNGKIVICSNTVVADDSVTHILVARLLENGNQDPSFANNGIFNYSVENGYNLAVGLKLQSNGKIVVSGITTNGQGINDNKIFILRLNSDGSLDQSFGTNGLSKWNFSIDNEIVTDMKIMQDNGFAISGYIQSSGGKDSCFIIKVLGNGQLDSTFAENGIFKYQYLSSSTYLNTLDITTENAIVAAGSYVPSTHKDFFLLKLTETGSIDTSFATQGVYTKSMTEYDNAFHTMKILENGAMVFAGYADVEEAIHVAHIILKLLPNGTEDTSFGGINTGHAQVVLFGGDTRIYGMDIQNDGKLVFAGMRYTGWDYARNLVVLRLNEDGTRDKTFRNNSYHIFTDVYMQDDYASSVAIQPDGKILVYGHSIYYPNTTDYYPTLVRYVGGNAPVAIEELDAGIISIKVAPNPFAQRTNLIIKLTEAKNVSYFISSDEGREVLSTKNLSLASGEHIIPLDLGGLPSGRYYCHIFLAGKSFVLPLVQE